MRCPQVAEYNTSVWAQYTIRTQDREGLCKELSESGIPSVAYYAVPLHLQPVFSDLGYSAGDFPVAEAIANDTLSLPMSPYLAKSDIDRIASVIRGVLV
ncbi:MAG: DegT/DnrJ/EryC1/StrS family aminotransferase [Pirellulaceae bacterium]